MQYDILVEERKSKGEAENNLSLLAAEYEKL